MDEDGAGRWVGAGRRIRVRMAEANLNSPKRLGELAGLSRPTVHRALNDRLTRDTAAKLAGVLGVTPAFLLEGAGEPGGSGAETMVSRDTTPGALPPLEPQWAASPVFWAGAQWATAGLSDRLAEIQRAVLAHLGQLTRPAPGARADPADELRVGPDPIPLDEPAEETTRPAPRRAGGGKR